MKLLISKSVFQGPKLTKTVVKAALQSFPAISNIKPVGSPPGGRSEGAYSFSCADITAIVSFDSVWAERPCDKKGKEIPGDYRWRVTSATSLKSSIKNFVKFCESADADDL